MATTAGRPQDNKQKFPGGHSGVPKATQTGTSMAELKVKGEKHKVYSKTLLMFQTQTL